MQNVTNEAQRNYLIQELITWKDYVLQIAAYNNKGVGAFSDGIKIKTKEGGEVTCHNSNPNLIKLISLTKSRRWFQISETKVLQNALILHAVSCRILF